MLSDVRINALKKDCQRTREYWKKEKKSQNKILTKRLEDKFEELFQKPEQNTKEAKNGNKKIRKLRDLI